MPKTSYLFLQEIRPRTIFVNNIVEKDVKWESLTWYNKLKLINCFLNIKNKKKISYEDLQYYIFYDIQYNPLKIEIISLKIHKII